MSKKEQLKELLLSMTLEEAKESGISAETYENIVKEGKDIIWKPKMNEEFYYVSDTDYIERRLRINCRFDDILYSEGNMYKTRELAKKALEYKNSKSSIFNHIENWLINNDDGWKVNWENDNQGKCYVYYDYERKYWKKDYNNSRRHNDTYMSEENAEKLVKELNDKKIVS